MSIFAVHNRHKHPPSPSRSHDSGAGGFAVIYCAVGAELTLHHAALDHQLVLVVGAVGVHQGGLIVLVEEVLLAQGLDLLVQPVQQRLVALADTAGAMVSWLPREGMPTV